MNRGFLLGGQADGDPVLWLPTAFAPSPAGLEIPLEGAGAGYHLYEMIKDPGDGTVDVFVDGVEVASDLPGTSLQSPWNVNFGAGSSCCLGQGNFNVVRFEIFGPEEPGCTGAPSGLVGWWTADGHARDIAGGNDGTVQGGATFVPGTVGQAFRFDATGDYVEIPDHSSLDLTTALTVDAWLTPDGAPVGGTIVSKYRSSSPNAQISWSFGVITDGRLRLTVCGTPTCSVLRTRDMNDTSVLPGVANHVAATFDVATNAIKFYVNGVERPSTLTNPSVLSSIATTTEPVRIGSFIAANNQIQSPVVGLTDEVEIFDRALSAEEIQRIAAVGPAGKCRTDHFMAYKTKITKGTPKPAKFGPVTLQDQFRTAEFTVIKPAQLLLPANKNGEGVLDGDTHLEEYRVSPVAGAPKFEQLSNVRVKNQCNNLLLEVKKPVSLLVPTAKDLATPPAVPTDSGVDHYLCYLAKPQKKDVEGNKLPKFPKGLQVEVTDQFQTRRYDLKKITKLCNPVDKSGAPLISNGPDAGEPKPISSAEIGDPNTHLVCYQAKLAKKHIAQDGCGPADPTDKGTKIEPKQEPHTKLSGVYVANQFGSEQVDTIKEFELCIPSTKALE